jgi:multiple sugar transport system substrate-binding protein
MSAGLTALLMVVALPACSSVRVTNVSQNSKAPLEIWVRQTPNGAVAKTAERIAKAFTQQSGIKTKVVALLEDFETKLQQQAAQRQLPDIVINDTAQLGNMHSQGWLEEVNQMTFPDANSISEQAWKAAQAYNGHYYGVPFSAQAFALFVRKDWRQKLKLPEPKSWDDLANLAVQFTEKDPDGNGKKDTFGLVIPGTTSRGYMSWYFTSFLLSNGADFLEVQHQGSWLPVINSAKAVQAVSWMQGMFCTKKAVNPDAVSMDTQRAHDTFEKGLGGIYLTGPYVLARFVKGVGSDKLEILPVPVGPSGLHAGSLAEGENVYLMSGSHNRSGQLKFAEFASSVAGQTIGMDGDNSGPEVRLPINKNVDLGAIRKDPRWSTFQQIYETSGVYAPAVPSWTPFRQMAADTLNALMADCGADVKHGLDALSDKYDHELQRQKSLMN